MCVCARACVCARMNKTEVCGGGAEYGGRGLGGEEGGREGGSDQIEEFGGAGGGVQWRGESKWREM